MIINKINYFKFLKLQQLLNNSKYIYIFQYTKLKNNNVQNFKKLFKNTTFLANCVKHVILEKILIKIKSGSLFIIISNTFLSPNKLLNFNLIYLFFKKKKVFSYSKLKLKKIFQFSSQLKLNKELRKNILILLLLIQSINKANIA